MKNDPWDLSGAGYEGADPEHLSYSRKEESYPDRESLSPFHVLYPEEKDQKAVRSRIIRSCGRSGFLELLDSYAADNDGLDREMAFACETASMQVDSSESSKAQKALKDSLMIPGITTAFHKGSAKT